MNDNSKTRHFTGKKKTILRFFLVSFSILCIYIALLSTFDTRINRALFVGLLDFFIFLLYPVNKHIKKRTNHIPIYDLILALLSLLCYGYVVFNCKKIIEVGILLTPEMLIIGALGIVLTLEACRRASGLPIAIVAIVFILIGYNSSNIKILIYNLYYSTEGVIGTPVRACISFISLFVLFGAFLERTGISDFFIKLANAFAGHTQGGPAKVAVISSALCGMVSGSSVGNTVTTGAITIPLMKKNGYKPEFAGAVEASASTGGQIMPPIMGAAAFLMIEYITPSVSYGYIASRACLPALLYFAGIFISVHLEAKKLGLKGLPKKDLPKLRTVLRDWYLILPLVVLIVLILKVTMNMAAIIAIFVAMFLSMFKAETCLSLEKFFDALESGAKSIISVGIACSVAGIIACIITTTGLGPILTSQIISLSSGNVIIAMFLTMLTCIVLGMGVPTTANYVIMASTCAPILIKMGLNPLSAHLFVFYFGIVADITPPVALAAYAGAAIANASAIKTAVNATLLAIAAFIVPYIFGLNPALLFIDTTFVEVIIIIITSLIGIFGVSSGIRGYIYKNMSVIEKIIIIFGGLMLIYPGILTDTIGIFLVSIVIIIQKIGIKNITLSITMDDKKHH